MPLVKKGSTVLVVEHDPKRSTHYAELLTGQGASVTFCGTDRNDIFHFLDRNTDIQEICLHGQMLDRGSALALLKPDS